MSSMIWIIYPDYVYKFRAQSVGSWQLFHEETPSIRQ